MAWLWIGDSILKGLVPFIAALWMGGYSDNWMNNETAFEAHNGWSTARYLRNGDHLVDLVDRHDSDVIVVLLGTNDASGEQQAIDNVEKLCELLTVQEVHDSGHVPQLVWIGSFTDEQQNGWEMQGVIKCRVMFLGASGYPGHAPLFVDGVVLAIGLERSRDGIHFTHQGYSDLTERVIQTVSRIMSGDDQ